MIDHLEGKLSLDDAIEKIKINTRQLAKAQRTWFKTFRNVIWIDIAPDATEETIIHQTISLIS
jgi:tRNA dimethylallyltransferase